MKKLFFPLFIVMMISSVFAQKVDRLPGSPYPASTVPDTLFLVDSPAYAPNKKLTISTLQGLLAQTKPHIYQNYNSGANYWLGDLQRHHGIVVDASFKRNFSGLMTHFKDHIKGYVICTPGNNSVNVAISLCGLTESVAVTEDNIDLFKSLGIPQTADVRDKDEAWFFENYGSEINKDILIYQIEDKYDFLSDYSVFGNMITFYEPLSGSTSRAIMRNINPHSPLLGWGDSEFDLVSRSSTYNIFVHPADWAKNLSTLSNFNVDLKQKHHTTTAKSQSSVHTVCFLFSDGDNIQWMLNEFATNSRWYGTTKRTKVNLGWTIPPALAEVAPTLLERIYALADTTSTGKDYFVAGPSGLGYMYPEKYDNLDGYTELLDRYMEKADLGIVNIIGNSDDDVYLEPFLKQPHTDALFFYFYSNYSGGVGHVKWVMDKPVIYARHNFWEGFESVNSLAGKLNKASRDIYSAGGYSLIPVHNWSRSVDDVIACVNLLDDDVRVVAPDEFVALIKQNLKPVSPILEFTPTNNATELNYLLPEYSGTGYDAVSRWADGEDKIIYKFNKDELLALSGGQFDMRLNVVVSNEYVVSMAPAPDGEYSVVHTWSETNEHIHDSSNRTRLYIDLKPYFDLGRQDVFLVFEDGIKSDGWGALLTFVQVEKSDLSTNVGQHQTTTAPSKFTLDQNYPNPFNPSTRISYSLEQSGVVTLSIYDLRGRHVQTLVNSSQPSGQHLVDWNGLDEMNQRVSSGIYLYRLSVNDHVESKKMILAR